MADVTSSGFWKQSMGPAPMWVWIVGGVVALYAFDLIKNKANKSKSVKKHDTKATESDENGSRKPNYELPHEPMNGKPQRNATGNSGTNAGNPPGHSGQQLKPRSTTGARTTGE